MADLVSNENMYMIILVPVYALITALLPDYAA